MLRYASPPLIEFDITFLGTGTSVGVPMVGCRCETCQSTDPRDNRLRSSIYVRTPGFEFIVDTGPDFRTQCLRYGITEIDAALFTHGHTDHVMGFDDLRRFTVGADMELPIYAPPGCLAIIKNAFGFAFSGENRYVGYLKPVPHEVTGPFPLGGFDVTPLPVSHGKVETVGYLFSEGGRKAFAYIPDCKTLSDQAMADLEGVESLIIDALRLTEHPTHLNFDEAKAVVAQLRPKRTWFTHFSCEVMHAREDASLPEGIRLAYDGLRLNL
jgi:phosphoribosyl 1,2-cyclic phosphate phosphodiesterase